MLQAEGGELAKGLEFVATSYVHDRKRAIHEREQRRRDEREKETNHKIRMYMLLYILYATASHI